MKAFSLSYREASLHYTRYGSGPRCLLLFHGFGQNRSVFDAWAEGLGSAYTIYAFDLFFHGASTWPMRYPVGKKHWHEIIEQFLHEHRIDRFDLGGFSLGAKFALVTLEAFPARVERLILLAPDGIRTSFWYSLATYPVATRGLFRSMITKPGRLYYLVTLLRKWRLVDKGILRFAERQMNTEEKRRQVYYSWVYFRHLRMGRSRLIALIQHHQTPVTMLVGRFDKIIRPRHMKKFCDQLPKASFIEVESGHPELIEKALPHLQ
ncbi:MAG: alpha/beta hydrolase [Cyclobacteriaceae bacterium]|nr:alpha/beta hydrolase [Cyclobacteriaceae bacterium]